MPGASAPSGASTAFGCAASRRSAATMSSPIWARRRRSARSPASPIWSIRTRRRCRAIACRARPMAALRGIAHAQQGEADLAGELRAAVRLAPQPQRLSRRLLSGRCRRSTLPALEAGAAAMKCSVPTSGAALTSVPDPAGDDASSFRAGPTSSLTTPPNGIRDLYASVGYGWKQKSARSKGVSADRRSTTGSTATGWSAITATRSTCSQRQDRPHHRQPRDYADYDADRFATDTRKFWLSTGLDDMTMTIREPHLVVVGNGMAGCRAVEELLARDPRRYASPSSAPSRR